MDTIRSQFLEAQEVLTSFISDDANILAIENAGALIVNSFKQKGKLMSCGNGGSMCDAMHFAEELSGRFRNNRPSLPAMAISDPSYMSCVINDYGADAVFSRFIEGMGFPGDVLIAISTSGNSKNVINAAQTAKAKGMMVIALTGKTGGELAALADVEIRAPHSKYADRVQEIHIKVIHSLIHYIELNMFVN
ncbi:D-sedoheptulose 7-phosphate isomerase [Flavobacteriales bacterium]|nr:D-sedoheptulose 7-phosphate isomerase [Flavobacteriales bacterium]MDG1395307.1 D-sedoheptulose 7-phosphate isomerase [Flavobacteriales bacterium]